MKCAFWAFIYPFTDKDLYAPINSALKEKREKIMEYLGYLGIKIDRVTNDNTRGVESIITTADSSVKVCVIPTNE